MKNEDQSRESPLALRPDRLIWRFHKSGAAGRFTRPFTDFDAERQAYVLAGLAARADEIPVLACILSSADWTVLTGARLVWHDGIGTHEVPRDQIIDATVTPDVARDAWTEGAHVSRLQVITRSGDRHTLQLEPGPPFSGFWNVLKTIAHANRAQSGGAKI